MALRDDPPGIPKRERGLQSAEALQCRNLPYVGDDGCKWTFLRRKRALGLRPNAPLCIEEGCVQAKSEMERGARPPRAQFSAPSRKTWSHRNEPNVRDSRARKMLAARRGQLHPGGCAPQTSEFGFSRNAAISTGLRCFESVFLTHGMVSGSGTRSERVSTVCKWPLLRTEVRAPGLRPNAPDQSGSA